MNSTAIPLPENAPKIGEIYQHYKGDFYKVFELALHANDHEWMVVYAPKYENADIILFTRPLREWEETVEWECQKIKRFTKI